MLEMMMCLTIIIMMVMTLMVIMMMMMMLMITKGIPSLAKSSFGPMPESISSLGLPTTPALKMIIMILTGLVMMTVIVECDD